MIGTGYAYDPNGNPTTYKTQTLTFDAENRITAYGTNMTVGYRGVGLRTWKQTSAGRRYFYYAGGNPYMETDAAGNLSAVNVFAPDGLVARGWTNNWTYYHFDPQGNVIERTNGAGTVLTNSGHDAYGAFASWATGNAPWAFNGKWGYYYDWEIGLYYCQNRYYDVANGRWLTRDPIGFAGGMNVYGYAGSRPVGRFDRRGTEYELGLCAAELAEMTAEAASEGASEAAWERVGTWEEMLEEIAQIIDLEEKAKQLQLAQCRSRANRNTIDDRPKTLYMKYTKTANSRNLVKRGTKILRRDILKRKLLVVGLMA